MKKGLLITLILSGAAALLTLSLRKSSKENPVDNPLAVGLRGQSRITRELTPIQREKLERFFLEAPPVLNITPGQSNARAQVDAINHFNQRQTR